MYNLTNLQNANDLSSMTSYVNEITGGVFAGLILISIFFILIMALKRYDFRHTVLASSFVCLILSSILLYAKMVNAIFPFIFLMILAGGFLWLMLNKD